jgi:hypothetical protein
MGLQLLHLFANASFHILERVEVVRREYGGAADSLEFGAEFVVIESEHAAVGVMDEDEFL